MKKLICTALLMLAAGCAQNRPTQTGFLADYQKLERTSDSQVFTYKALDDLPLKCYRVQITTTEFAIPDNQISSGDRQALASHADATFFATFNNLCLNGREFSTVTLRTIITELAVPNRLLNWFTLLLFAPISTGGITLEIEASDGATGKQLAAMVCAKQANNFAWKDFKAAFSLYGHAKNAIDECAALFKDLTKLSKEQL